MTAEDRRVLRLLVDRHQVVSADPAFHASCARLARAGLVWFKRIDAGGPLAMKFGAGATYAYPYPSAYRQIAEVLA
jgi:hypothetical protein